MSTPHTSPRFRPMRFGVTRVHLRDGAPGTHYLRAEQALLPYPERLTDRLRHWADNRALFPRGVDVVLTAGRRFIALPRTTKIREMEA